MDEGAYSCIAQIAAPAGGVKGAGFLVPGGCIITCAHVVNQALNRRNDSAEQPGPHETVLLTFPWSQNTTTAYRGTVIAWRAMPATPTADGCVDVAILQ